jgi:hypothetical protein
LPEVEMAQLSLAVVVSSDGDAVVSGPAVNSEIEEFRRRRIDIYLRSARSHEWAAASEEHTAHALEFGGYTRAAERHRQISAEHRLKAARNRLLAETYSLPGSQ